MMTLSKTRYREFVVYGLPVWVLVQKQKDHPHLNILQSGGRSKYLFIIYLHAFTNIFFHRVEENTAIFLSCPRVIKATSNEPIESTLKGWCSFERLICSMARSWDKTKPIILNEKSNFPCMLWSVQIHWYQVLGGSKDGSRLDWLGADCLRSRFSCRYLRSNFTVLGIKGFQSGNTVSCYRS